MKAWRRWSMPFAHADRPWTLEVPPLRIYVGLESYGDLTRDMKLALGRLPRHLRYGDTVRARMLRPWARLARTFARVPVRRHERRPALDEGVPAHVGLRVVHLPAVTGQRAADVIVLLGGQDLEIYRIELGISCALCVH
jgi:hypothetical protein